MSPGTETVLTFLAGGGAKDIHYTTSLVDVVQLLDPPVGQTDFSGRLIEKKQPLPFDFYDS